MPGIDDTVERKQRLVGAVAGPVIGISLLAPIVLAHSAISERMPAPGVASPGWWWATLAAATVALLWPLLGIAAMRRRPLSAGLKEAAWWAFPGFCLALSATHTTYGVSIQGWQAAGWVKLVALICLVTAALAGLAAWALHRCVKSTAVAAFGAFGMLALGCYLPTAMSFGIPDSASWACASVLMAPTVFCLVLGIALASQAPGQWAVWAACVATAVPVLLFGQRFPLPASVAMLRYWDINIWVALGIDLGSGMLIGAALGTLLTTRLWLGSRVTAVGGSALVGATVAACLWVTGLLVRYVAFRPGGSMTQGWLAAGIALAVFGWASFGALRDSGLGSFWSFDAICEWVRRRRARKG